MSAGVAVFGAGPAGLMAAEVLAQGGARVTLYDRMGSPGRKFLLAGRGGLNLTHSEDFERLLRRYGAAAEQLGPALEAFPPDAIRTWCEGLGEPTFVGSSGRVFPRSFKASPLLRAWLRRLASLGVVFAPRHHFEGWNAAGAAICASLQGKVAIEADAFVFALGGASWPHLGADGDWVTAFQRAEIAVVPLQASNCGVMLPWSSLFISRFEGAPLKTIAVTFDARTERGDAVITRGGLEGGVVYAHAGGLREKLAAEGTAQILISLRPDLALASLEQRLTGRLRKQSLSTFLKKALRLSPVAIGLLHEAAPTPLAGLAPNQLAQLVAALPLRVAAVAPLARAISSAGGVDLNALDLHYMLRRRPGVFVAGEMLDWDAPTGGYLLQACLATGRAAGHGALRWLTQMRGEDAAQRRVI
jgi:uncharacterized flavoprotein (TIGR03862 family)